MISSPMILKVRDQLVIRYRSLDRVLTLRPNLRLNISRYLISDVVANLQRKKVDSRLTIPSAPLAAPGYSETNNK